MKGEFKFNIRGATLEARLDSFIDQLSAVSSAGPCWFDGEEVAQILRGIRRGQPEQSGPKEDAA